MQNHAASAAVTPPDAGDEALLAGLRAGHAEAFTQLMRRYNRLLFRTARGIVSDDAEAQDAVQEAYLRAFVALDSYRGESSLRTWLTRIVINQALGQQRKLGRVVFLDESLPADEEGAMSETPGRTGGIDPGTPEQAASNNELRRQLEAAIDLLPPIYRCVFILRAIDGMSVEDTAESLRVSADVVKTRYLRARGMLRRHLDGGGNEVHLSALHDFQGARCDDMVRQVLARLRAAGVVRDQ
jgi:RNA polymerase sigma-70 factor, ECF subfamily